MKQNKAATVLFLNLSTFFNHSVSMALISQVNATSEEYQYIHVIVDVFSN